MRLAYPVGRCVERKIIDDDMDDLVGEPVVALPVVGEIERLWLCRECSGGLDDDKIVDERVKLGQPDLQNVQLIEEREAVEYARHFS